MPRSGKAAGSRCDFPDFPCAPAQREPLPSFCRSGHRRSPIVLSILAQRLPPVSASRRRGPRSKPTAWSQLDPLAAERSTDGDRLDSDRLQMRVPKAAAAASSIGVVNYVLTLQHRQASVSDVVRLIEEELAEQIREAITEAVNTGVRDASSHDEAEPMLVVAVTQVAAEHAQQLLSQSVSAARHGGHSWSSVGEQLGVTRQAAQQRYGSAGTPVAGPSQRLLKPVTAFDEIGKLADAGARGWHSISYGWLYHLLEQSDQQWEHRREAFPLPGNRKRLESQGWMHIGTTYPWQYLKRPLGKPPVPDAPHAP